MSTVRLLAAVIVFLGVGFSKAHAEIADSSDVGFTLKFTALAKATPDKSYRALTNSVGKWWSSEHTYTGDARNLSIQDRPGGCFCERFPAGGGIEHMRVVYSSPGEALRLLGALGPLQEMGMQGSMTWAFAKEGDGTRIKVTYAVGGYCPGGPGALAPIVDRVIGEQFDRLLRFLETGFPEAPKK